jgi:hypothetical protein
MRRAGEKNACTAEKEKVQMTLAENNDKQKSCSGKY